MRNFSDLVSWFDPTKCPHLSKNGILYHTPKVGLSCKIPDPCKDNFSLRKRMYLGSKLLFAILTFITWLKCGPLQTLLSLQINKWWARSLRQVEPLMDGQAEYISTHERPVLSTNPKSFWSSWAHHLMLKFPFMEKFSLRF